MTGINLLEGTIADWTGDAVVAAGRRGAVALLPIGVIECHGPHLPTGTDAFLATKLCQLTAQYASDSGRETVVAPPYYWGINSVLEDFPGSFRVRPETAAMLLEDVINSLDANDFSEVMLVSHHGDRAHNEMIASVLGKAHAKGQTGVRWLYAPFRWRMYERLGMTGKEPIWVPWEPTPEFDAFKLTGILGVHAEEFETAGIVRYFPDTVNYDALRALEPTHLGPDDLAKWRKGGDDARAVTPDGYFGAPNPVDPDLWRHYDLTARVMAAAIARRA